ncbi:MAG: flavin reductase family protein [Pseudomonadota bacterium]
MISPDEFRRACGLWATGVSVVTTANKNGNPFGLTMNAVSSLSLDPPMFLVCVDNGSDTMVAMLESRVFCINVLTGSQTEISNKFAKKGQDKFESINWRPGNIGAPVIGEALLSVECRIAEIFTGGDHKIMAGEVAELHKNDSPDAEPLLYYGGGYRALRDA